MHGVASVAATVGVGAAVGLLGAVVMDVPMAALPEGFTPAFVAAGKLTGTDPDAVPDRTAYAVHHAAGVLAGVPFGLGVAVGEPLVGATWPAGLLAAFGVLCFLLGFFLLVVLPRTAFDAGRERAVARAWVLSAFVYAVTLTFVGPLAMTLR